VNKRLVFFLPLAVLASAALLGANPPQVITAGSTLRMTGLAGYVEPSATIKPATITASSTLRMTGLAGYVEPSAPIKPATITASSTLRMTGTAP
jgi:hypothetical protein